MKYLFNDLIRGTLGGKTVLRILMNNRVRKTPMLQGKILDLGSGKIRSSYYNFLKINKDAKIISVEISDDRRPDLKVNLEKTFPFKNEDFDNILCFNLLEHIFDHQNVIKESFRTLKHHGKFIGAVPFLTSVHPDPEDYFRYTQVSLEKLFKQAGFSQIHVEALGFGPFCVSYYMTAFLLPKILRLFFLLPAILFDQLVASLKKIHGKDKYVLIYYFECKK